MNYQIKIVTGEAASFFLSEWPLGGVEITDDAVGLFGALKGSEQFDLAEQLNVYGLVPVSWTLLSLVKIGLSTTWTWQKAVWDKSKHTSFMRQVESRLQGLLERGISGSTEDQLSMLKLVQAGTKRAGLPVRLEGEVRLVTGGVDRVWLYPSGVIAYSRTPHPMPFLRAVAAVTTAAVATEDV